MSVAALLGLVGALLSLVEFVWTLTSAFVSSVASVQSASLSSFLTELYLVTALGALGAIFGFVGLCFYLIAFRALAPGDGRFKTPATLTLMALISVVLALGLSIALVVVLVQSISCTGAEAAISSTCLNFGALAVLFGLLLVVAIVALIGCIGLLIGIWRLGTRFDESGFHVGAILVIFPFVNVLGYVLILLAARSARHRLENRGFALGYESDF